MRIERKTMMFMSADSGNVGAGCGFWYVAKSRKSHRHTDHKYCYEDLVAPKVKDLPIWCFNQ